MNSGLGGASGYSLAIDRSTATLYAGTTNGVFKTTNGAASWTSANSGLGLAVVYALAIDPTSTATLYAETRDTVFKTTNGGGSWAATNISLAASGVVKALAIDLSATSTVYVGTDGDGVFKTTDGGSNWNPANAGLTGLNAYVHAIAVSAPAPSIVYAGTDRGVSRSIDAGTSWTPVNAGLANPTVNALAVDPSAPLTIYAGTRGGGVFKSVNGGASWTAANAGLSNLFVHALAIDPSAPGTVFAGTSAGIFKSTNGGSTWAAVGPSNISVNTFAIAPSDPTRVYAGTSNGPYRSTDRGASWSFAVLPSNVTALAVHPSSPGTVYAGTNGDGFWSSTNGGGSWSTTVTNLFKFVSALAIDPNNPSTLYSASNGGVFKSTNGGQTWNPLTADPGPSATALVADRSAPLTLYAATSGLGVYDFEGPGTCAAGATVFCGNGSRFRVTARWTTPDGKTGEAQAIALTSDTGYFWFFSSGNVEMVVKVVDGRGFNNRFWVFAGGLTNVNVVLFVFDTQTGAMKIYTNPQGTAFQPIQDTSAFTASATSEPAEVASEDLDSGVFEPRDSAEPPAPPLVTESLSTPAACVPDATTLCLNGGRFKVQTQWKTSQGQSGAGQAVTLTSDTGYFWFFSASNVEMVVKALNACTFNSRFWVFAGGLTDVNVVMTVTDTLSGVVKTYTNPQSTAFQPILDTAAFATCP